MRRKKKVCEEKNKTRRKGKNGQRDKKEDGVKEMERKKRKLKKYLHLYGTLYNFTMSQCSSHPMSILWHH